MKTWTDPRSGITGIANSPVAEEFLDRLAEAHMENERSVAALVKKVQERGVVALHIHCGWTRPLRSSSQQENVKAEDLRDAHIVLAYPEFQLPGHPVVGDLIAVYESAVDPIRVFFHRVTSVSQFPHLWVTTEWIGEEMP